MSTTFTHQDINIELEQAAADKWTCASHRDPVNDSHILVQDNSNVIIVESGGAMGRFSYHEMEEPAAGALPVVKSREEAVYRYLDFRSSINAVLSAPTRHQLLGRPDGWTGKLLAGVYEADVEYAIYENVVDVEHWEIDSEPWRVWKEQNPEAIGYIVEYIKNRLIDNLVIDARLDEYVIDARAEMASES